MLSDDDQIAPLIENLHQNSLCCKNFTFCHKSQTLSSQNYKNVHPCAPCGAKQKAKIRRDMHLWLVKEMILDIWIFSMAILSAISKEIFFNHCTDKCFQFLKRTSTSIVTQIQKCHKLKKKKTWNIKQLKADFVHLVLTWGETSYLTQLKCVWILVQQLCQSSKWTVNNEHWTCIHPTTRIRNSSSSTKIRLIGSRLRQSPLLW